MPTPSEIKTAINTDIRIKTADNSITTDQVSDILDDIVDLYGGDIQTLTDGATIVFNANNGLWAKVTIGGNRTFSWSNFANGMSGIIKVIQDGTGARTINWGTAVEPSGGITLNADPNGVTFVGYVVMDGVISLFAEGAAPSGGLPEISKGVFSAAPSGGISIIAGEVLLGFLVNAISAQTGFKIGTTPGGDEIISEQDLAATTGPWHSFPMLFRNDSTQTFYITAPSGLGVQYQPIILNA